MTKYGMVYLKIEKRKMKIINTHFLRVVIPKENRIFALPLGKVSC